MNNLFKRSGFTLVEISMAMALMAIVSVAVFELSGISSKDNRSLSLSRVATDYRNRILSNIRNPVAWQSTTAFNSSFACFAPGSSCNLNPAEESQGYYDFVVIGSDPTALEKLSYQATDATTRISLSSSKCESGTPNPSNTCPLKYIAKWKPICSTYPCTNAQIEIKVDLIYDFPGEVPFNTSKYTMRVVRDFLDTSVEVVCAALNGSFNATTGLCTPKYAGKSCPSYQVVSSVNSNGDITCKPLYTGQCDAATQLVSAINPSGQVQCGARPACAGPPPPPPPPPPPGDSCSTTFCHLNKLYSCTRTNGVASPITFMGLSCTDEDGGINRCTFPNCVYTP